ncbi:AsmA-like C-terminal region-containing protein [Mesorhizobium sp. CAU 1741]|uniref:AsmA-like C-terminal region-containing protein n=1 Tax=Mesorhizobium sp. CAU 1741 TaxID=3140366 RepID=UPI00325B8E14
MLALTVALVAPYFVDWTSYRADFEREAGRILGREVRVEGTATARLLPFPSVTFTDVVVAGTQPGQPSMTVETFSMDAELAPFMQGELHIFDMRLVRPSVMVEMAADGTLDWAVRPSVPVQASHISLEKLTVTEGSVAVRHAASGRTHELTEINANISARSLTGPWRMDGSLRLDGMRTALVASTGAVDDGRMRVRVDARPELYPFVLETDGDARIEDGRMRYAGQFRLDALTTSDRLRVSGGGTIAVGETESEEEGPPAYRIGGMFALDHEALDIEEFRFETGPLDDPYTADGSARFGLGQAPDFFVRADGAQIRIADAVADASGAASFDQRLIALREFILDMPRPAIPGSVELALPAIVAGDTTIRDVRLRASPSEGGWAVESLAATMPGRATLEARGDLSIGMDDLGFAGSLLLAVGQPSGFAAWLSRDIDEAIRRLPAAGFSATVELNEERQIFRDLELVLGAARFNGEIDSRTPSGERPSMALRLDGDALDVEGLAAFASIFINDSGETRFGNRDLAFDIAAGPVTVGGMTAETLDTALRLNDGRLEIDRLSIGGLAGANISATGTVRNLATEPSGSIDANVIATDLAPLADTLAARFPESRIAAEISRRAANYPGLLEDASIQLVASAAAGEAGSTGLALNASGEAGGTSFTLTASTPEASTAPAGRPLKLQLDASNGEAAALYAALGLPALPLGLADGAEVTLAFDGIPDSGGQTRLAFSGEGLALEFNGQTSITPDGWSANGMSSIRADDLEPWLAVGGVSLPGYGYGLPLSAQAQLDVDGGLFVLSGIQGEVAQEPVSGDLNVQIVDSLPHVTGALALRYVDLGAVAEMAVGSEALVNGERWPTAPFAQNVSTPVSTDLELTAQQLGLGTFADATTARLRLRLGTQGVSVSEASISVYGGTLTGLMDFRNDAGTGLLSTQFTLEGARASNILGDIGVEGTVDLTAALTGSGKSVDGLMASLAGSGTASVEDVVVRGVDPLAFPALLSEADAVGPEIDAEATARFAPPLVRSNQMRASAVDFAFTVANGTARVPPILLQTPEASLSAELRADIGAGTVGADALLTYDPGLEALVGSEPAVRLSASGPLDEIRIDADTQPLAQFLTQRALELEQQRVEAMQAALIEQQRLRREARYYAARVEERERAAEEARNALEQSERLRREIQQQQDEAERRAAEEERLRRDEEAESRRIEEETRRIEQDAERERLAEDERAAAERQRAADEVFRAEVEALLRSRAETTAARQGEQDETVSPPALEVTPSPRPSAPPEPFLSLPDNTTSPAAGSSDDGFMRLIFGDD